MCSEASKRDGGAGVTRMLSSAVGSNRVGEPVVDVKNDFSSVEECSVVRYSKWRRNGGILAEDAFDCRVTKGMKLMKHATSGRLVEIAGHTVVGDPQ